MIVVHVPFFYTLLIVGGSVCGVSLLMLYFIISSFLLRSALDYLFLFPLLVKIPIIAVPMSSWVDVLSRGVGTVHEKGGRRPVFARLYKNPSHMPLFDSNICQVRKSNLLSLG